LRNEAHGAFHVAPVDESRSRGLTDVHFADVALGDLADDQDRIRREQRHARLTGLQERAELGRALLDDAGERRTNRRALELDAALRQIRGRARTLRFRGHTLRLGLVTLRLQLQVAFLLDAGLRDGC